MSDDFDKEAERQRLREKYEDEREDREATERMSELLLQGATMTNKHCDTCGSPIFRYEGQEFCPTCQVPTGESARGAQDATQDVEGAAQGDQDAAQDANQSAQGAAQQGQGSEGTAQGSARAETADQASQPAQTSHAAHPGQPATTAHVDADAAMAGGESLEDARAALVSAVSTLARRAAAADDPRRAKDLLSAAREAAEALDALRGQ